MEDFLCWVHEGIFADSYIIKASYTINMILQLYYIETTQIYILIFIETEEPVSRDELLKYCTLYGTREEGISVYNSILEKMPESKVKYSSIH